MAGTCMLHVQCPECDVVVPITVRAELARVSDQQQTINLEPDLLSCGLTPGLTIRPKKITES